ncbi:MAG: hypothetical protein ACRDID_17940 [Ktedonobacterales bacterium]
MGAHGQHVLIVEEGTARQAVFELVMQRTGRRATLATNYAEAVAVLRSSLHPLVVYVNAALPLEGDTRGSLLLELLGNPEFAATDAFIISSTLDPDLEGDLRKRVAQRGAGYAEWLRLPAKVSQMIAAQEQAEAWLKARG